MGQFFRILWLVAIKLMILPRPTTCNVPHTPSVIHWNCNEAASLIYVSDPDWTDSHTCFFTEAYTHPTKQDAQTTCLQNYLSYLNYTRGQEGYVIDVGNNMVGCYPDGAACGIVCKQSPPSASGSCPLYNTTNGSVATYPTGRTVYSQLTISCIPGFEYVNTDITVLTCEPGAKWGAPFAALAQCKVVTCPALVDPPNGIVSSGNITPSASREYSCHTGFEISENSTTSCLANGSWSAPPPTCKVVTCPALVDPPNGIVSSGNSTYNASGEYSCDFGFTLSGHSTISCLANGLWSAPPPTCEVVTCPALVDPPNGIVSSSNSTYNASGEYSCDFGFTLSGNSTISCLANGLWSAPPPTCEAITCPALLDPPNGIVSIGNNTYNASREYSCDFGLEIFGNSTTSCLENGSWSAPQPTCKGSTIISKSTPGTAQTSGPQSATGPASIALHTSTPGHASSTGLGDTTGPATETGPVSSILPSTTNAPGVKTVSDTSTVPASTFAALCPALTAPQNGNISIGSTETHSVRRFSCSTGYKLKGDSALACFSTGNWSSPPPTCIATGNTTTSCGIPDTGTKAPPVSNEEEQSSSNMAAIAGGTIGGLFGVGCLLFFFVHRSKKRSQQENPIEILESNILLPHVGRKEDTERK